MAPRNTGGASIATGAPEATINNNVCGGAFSSTGPCSLSIDFERGAPSRPPLSHRTGVVHKRLEKDFDVGDLRCAASGRVAKATNRNKHVTQSGFDALSTTSPSMRENSWRTGSSSACAAPQPVFYHPPPTPPEPAWGWRNSDRGSRILRAITAAAAVVVALAWRAAAAASAAGYSSSGLASLGLGSHSNRSLGTACVPSSLA